MLSLTNEVRAPMLFNPVDGRWLYNAVDGYQRMMQPMSDYYLRAAKQLNRVSDVMNLPMNVPYMPDANIIKMFTTPRQFLKLNAGTLYVAHMLMNHYQKPTFGIEEVKVDNHYYEVVEDIILKKSFCHLLQFRKVMEDREKPMPKLLLVAPMSGHYATLLRGTVKELLPFYDVYITDWQNARDVPLTEGSFDFDEFVSYLITFMRELGPNLHVMAVCQPTVPLLVALSMMSTDQEPNLPQSAILLGGPIDTSQAPTAVNTLATSHSDDWFKQNLISVVPSHYRGYMRLVYPGFMQLMGFMNMNLQRHMESLQKAIIDFSYDKREDALKTVHFYTEYFSTMDLTSEFYLQTIDTIFQRKLLTKGSLKTAGRFVNVEDINNTAILAIEGEKDDITGIGQTKSVLSLCKNLPDDMKKYMLVKDVGHYGLFNGSKFRKMIIPEIRRFTSSYDALP